MNQKSDKHYGLGQKYPILGMHKWHFWWNEITETTLDPRNSPSKNVGIEHFTPLSDLVLLFENVEMAKNYFFGQGYKGYD